MVKLCYTNNGRKTDEYYFDLKSQKVYKICLSAYYAKQNTRGIPLLLISGGILATLLEQVSQRVLLSKNGGILLLLLVIGILVVIDKKVKKSFIEKYQYIENHTMGSNMEKIEVSKLYELGKWSRRILGIIAFIGLFIFLLGMFFTIQTNHLTGGFWALVGGMVGVIFFRYGEFMEAVKVKKYLRTSKS